MGAGCGLAAQRGFVFAQQMEGYFLYVPASHPRKTWNTVVSLRIIFLSLIHFDSIYFSSSQNYSTGL